MEVLVFTLDSARYAVPLERLLEVAPRILTTPLAGAPAFVEGIFSYRARPCVAVSLRRRFGRPPRRASLDEHLVVVRGKARAIGLVVDRVEGHRTLDPAAIEDSPFPTPEVRGVVSLADGIVLVHDVDALLTDEDETAIGHALEAAKV